jgi:phage baseplate assembly protein W
VATIDPRFGVDMRLLSDLERQVERDRGSDLRTVAGPRGTDLDTLAGGENLRQALLLRFLTRTGELAALGHPAYGCRLYELIGERNTETTRNRAKLFVLQALAAEPRVAEVRAVRVAQGRDDRTRIDIDVTLVAIDSDVALNLVFPFFLDGSAAT